jgi:prepilin-type N-terminal cleavage/methylation domain-containing protein
LIPWKQGPPDAVMEIIIPIRIHPTKTNKTMKSKLNKGFTLIELLVVITIIAILASIAVPVFNTVTEKAKVSKTVSNVKQIVLACRVFAVDYNGQLPTSDILGNGRAYMTSDDAWADLADSGILLDPMYWTAGARGCAPTKPVNYGAADIDATMNYYTYISGLADTDRGALCVVVEGDDGRALTGASTWTVENGHPWTKSTVAGFLDGSAGAQNISPANGTLIGTEAQAFGTMIDTIGGVAAASGSLAPVYPAGTAESAPSAYIEETTP